MTEDVPLGLDFNGDIELLLDRPTANGHRRLVVTSGQIDDQAKELFARSHCHWLAGAIHSLTGWEIVTFDAQSETGKWEPIHSAARTPDGRIVDILGEHASADQLVARYSRERNGQAVRHRIVRSENVPGDVLNGSDNRGDPLWWARGSDRPTQAVFLHFARLVIEQHRHKAQADPTRKPAQHAQHIPTPRKTATPAHTQPEGTAMSSVEDLRLSLAAANQRAAYAAGGLKQADLEIEEAQTLLAQALQGTSNPEAEQVLSIFAQLREHIGQALGGIDPVSSAIDSYMAHL